MSIPSRIFVPSYLHCCDRCSSQHSAFFRRPLCGLVFAWLKPWSMHVSSEKEERTNPIWSGHQPAVIINFVYMDYGESTVDCLCAQGLPGFGPRNEQTLSMCTMPKFTHAGKKIHFAFSLILELPFCFNTLFLGRKHKCFLFAPTCCMISTSIEANREYVAKRLRHQKEDRITGTVDSWFMSKEQLIIGEALVDILLDEVRKAKYPTSH